MCLAMERNAESPIVRARRIFSFYLRESEVWDLRCSLPLLTRLYSGLNALAFILSYLLVPGTQRVTLEEMNWICMLSLLGIKSYLLILSYSQRENEPSYKKAFIPPMVETRKANSLEP